MQTKAVIIGKLWLNGESSIMPSTLKLDADMTIKRNEQLYIGKKSLRIARDLGVEQLDLKAGEELVLFANNAKRTNNDPDFTVSIRRPEAEAIELINASMVVREAYKSTK